MSLLRGLQPPSLSCPHTLVSLGTDPHAPCKKLFLNCIFKLLQGLAQSPGLWPSLMHTAGILVQRWGVTGSPGCPHSLMPTPLYRDSCTTWKVFQGADDVGGGAPVILPSWPGSPQRYFSWAEG